MSVLIIEPPIHYTYSTEQSPSWDVSRFPSSQETPWILWNPKVRYRVRVYPPPVPILSQTNPVHAPSYFFKIHLNITPPSTVGSNKWSVSFMFPLPHTFYMPCPPHASRFDHPNNIWWGVQIIKLLITYFSLLSCYLVLLRHKYSPLHPILTPPQPTLLPQCAIHDIFHHGNFQTDWCDNTNLAISGYKLVTRFIIITDTSPSLTAINAIQEQQKHCKYDPMSPCNISVTTMKTAWRIFYTQFIFHSPGVYLVPIKPTPSEIVY
jgi:hypothetical protein